ncbi:hypothetical protein E3N88_12359 [Mikania micrantha]|uniref:Reverse transcriptase Ty1/copia-type domain-containing protein n=1 Tax=Mikania micrantha TaxID=192012 RepID=A0A5N6P5A3_9ASTR|nr:hypothetical protein E3N88_12359 [Mikania micrantha]
MASTGCNDEKEVCCAGAYRLAWAFMPGVTRGRSQIGRLFCVPRASPVEGTPGQAARTSCFKKSDVEASLNEEKEKGRPPLSSVPLPLPPRLPSQHHVVVASLFRSTDDGTGPTTGFNSTMGTCCSRLQNDDDDGNKLLTGFTGIIAIQDVLTQFHMEGAKDVTTPISTTEPFILHGPSPLANATLYRRLVGSLLYLAFTHPNISFAINKLSQFMHAPPKPIGKFSKVSFG